MKKILAAVVAAVLSASPALAANSISTAAPQKAAASQEGTLRVEFARPIIGEAAIIRPGNTVTLRVRVRGPKKNTIILSGPQGWIYKWNNIIGEKSKIFYVNSYLPAEEARFKVVGTSADGQTSDDEIVFTSLGSPVPPVATASAPAAPVATASAPATPATGSAALPATESTVAAPVATASAIATAFALPIFRYEISHNSRPLTPAAIYSNNFTAQDLRLKFGNGMLLGFKALSAPEQTDANPHGAAGYIPYLGWASMPMWAMNAELMLGAQVPVSGGATSAPLYIAMSLAGNPGWERLTHRMSAYTDLTAKAVQYAASLRLAGDANNLRLAAVGGTSHKWQSTYKPQVWLGVEVAGPVSLLGADAAVGIAYDIPVPTTGKSYTDGVRGWLTVSQF